LQVAFAPQTQSLVQNVRLRAAFEHEGKRNKGLHVHILIEVTHTTMVQISKEGLVQIFRQFVHKEPNVHCRFLRGNGEDKDFILHYITKEVPSYAPNDIGNRQLRSAFRGGDDVAEDLAL
jgi:predicted SnoaL-like aldol condensation-catalyzing enzyme